MPYQATIQIAIQTYDGAIWMFRRMVTLNAMPFPGFMYSGRGLPSVLPRDTGWDCEVINVGEDLDTGMIFVNLRGFRAATYTKEEMQASLGAGWYAYDQPLCTPEMAAAEGEDADESDPGDSSG